MATLGVLLHAVGSGCVSSSLPSLLPPSSEPTNTGNPVVSSGPYETATIVPGTPTQVYTLVARGVLGCWFGAGGPLETGYVFHAEAEPPAKGGAAEIVIHERDTSFRDRRGPQAYRAAFASEIGGVRVGMTARKFEAKLAQAMARDVETWARGNAGCQLRALLPPRAPSKGRVVERRAPGKSSRKR
jgi:hypothetical protein